MLRRQEKLTAPGRDAHPNGSGMWHDFRSWLGHLAECGLVGCFYFVPGFFISLFWWAVAPDSLVRFFALVFFHAPYVFGAVHALDLNRTGFGRGLLLTSRHCGSYGLILVVGLFGGVVFGLLLLFVQVGLSSLHLFLGRETGMWTWLGLLCALFTGSMIRFWPTYYLYLTKPSRYDYEGYFLGVPWKATSQRGSLRTCTLPALAALFLLYLTMGLASDGTFPGRDACLSSMVFSWRPS